MIRRRDLHGFCVAVVRDLQVPLKGEYTGWAWHLEYQVGVVGTAMNLAMAGLPRMAW
jgi:hypothetical protein